jgi:hypothetical protein
MVGWHVITRQSNINEPAVLRVGVYGGNTGFRFAQHVVIAPTISRSGTRSILRMIAMRYAPIWCAFRRARFLSSRGLRSAGCVRLTVASP